MTREQLEKKLAELEKIAEHLYEELSMIRYDMLSCKEYRNFQKEAKWNSPKDGA